MKVRKYRIEKQVRIDKGLGFEGVADSEPLVSSFDWELIKQEWYSLQEINEYHIVKKEDRDFHKEYVFYFLYSCEFDDLEDEEDDFEDIDSFVTEK